MGVTVYALGFIDTMTTPPTVIGVGIYSDDAGDICVNQVRSFPFRITEVYAVDFVTGRAGIETSLRQHFPWAAALYENAPQPNLQGSSASPMDGPCPVGMLCLHEIPCPPRPLR